jgi:KTSC domain
MLVFTVALAVNKFMRAHEFIAEGKVKSSWIARVEYSGAPSRTLTIVLKNGNVYTVPGISQNFYNRMLTNPSKGKYYHQFIKDKYKLTKVGQRQGKPAAF